MKKIIFCVFLCFFLCSCGKQTEINGFSMDAPYSIKIVGLSEEKSHKIKKTLDGADKIFDAYENSFLYTLNQDKYIEKTDENADLFEAVNASLPYCNSYFDISLRAFTKLWSFSEENPVPPTDTALNEAKKSVGASNIVFSDNEIKLINNCEIELGAVAKGYMCDKVYEIAEEFEGIFDIGGTVKSSYTKPVTVGIRNPDGGILCSFSIKKGESVSTSGSYERSFYYNDKLYHHILDPKTGTSANSGVKSVTVISDSALKSDILSTTYFVSGIENAQIPENVTVIFVNENGEIILKGKERKLNYSTSTN